MVTLLDQGVGQVIAKVKELGIADNTLIIYTSDNGANRQFIKDLKSSGGLRGQKRSLYEGGIRAPFVAYWPGKIKPGSTSDMLTSSIDLMTTAAEIAGIEAPSHADGISYLPTLLGNEQKEKHESLYFEIYEGSFQQCARMGNWKGYRKGTKDPVEVYDLSIDPAEQNNIADSNPDIAKQLDAIMIREHTPSENYNTPEHASAKGGGKKGKRGKKGKKKSGNKNS